MSYIHGEVNLWMISFDAVHGPRVYMAYNSMMHVGNWVHYDDRDFICYTARIVEQNGQLGFILFDDTFHEIRDCVLDPNYREFSLDFEILDSVQQWN